MSLSTSGATRRAAGRLPARRHLATAGASTGSPSRSPTLPRARARPARPRPLALGAALGRRRAPAAILATRARRAGGLGRPQLRRAARRRARRPRSRARRAARAARPRAPGAPARRLRPGRARAPGRLVRDASRRPSRRATTPAACCSRRASCVIESDRGHLEPGRDGRLRYRYCKSAVIAAWSIMASPPPPPAARADAVRARRRLVAHARRAGRDVPGRARRPRRGRHRPRRPHGLLGRARRDERRARALPRLEDPRAERARDQLDRELRGLVLAVEDRVHLDHLERARSAPTRRRAPSPGAPRGRRARRGRACRRPARRRGRARPCRG